MCKFCAGIELYCCSVVLFEWYEWYVECMLQFCSSPIPAALSSSTVSALEALIDRSWRSLDQSEMTRRRPPKHPLRVSSGGGGL